MVHMNIFYMMDLQICDSKSGFWRNIEHLGIQKIKKICFGVQHLIQNIVILSFTTKSGAPDHPIRSVSLS